MKVTVVMPTYNEAENLPRMVDSLFSLGIPGLSILIIDDNSPDGTGNIAEELAKERPQQIQVIHRPGKQGLGTAYVLGFSRAIADGADYIIEMDADFSHPLETLPSFLENIKEYDVVVGSRFCPGGKVDERWGLGRRFLSWGGNAYARWVTGLKVHDTTAGFKCFRREVLESMDLSNVRSEGFAFQVEMAYACQKKGFQVIEVPITFRDRTHGQSKMSLRIILEAAWRVWDIRRRY